MSRRICLLAVTLLLLGCEGQQFGAREKGALTGGALGAGLGAIIGNQVGSSGAGIAIGSGLGALAGGLVGEGIDEQDRALDERNARIAEQERLIAENKRLLAELRAEGLDVSETARGVRLHIPDVLFEFDSSRLTPAARQTAQTIARIVNEAPDRTIAVEGHTDSVGTVGYNQRLSEDRARSVADALVRENVSSRRLKVRGYGERDPIAPNESPAGRARNRRVEVIIEN